MTKNQIEKSKIKKYLGIIKAAVTGIFSGGVKFLLERIFSES
ncbi:hypothetical protein [Bacillus altitudinis]|nr:hypothetical protein [Bacillus altitudinis]WHX70458.1 hypothetical protein QNH40_13095 [Bacillus altitudinis]